MFYTADRIQDCSQWARTRSTVDYFRTPRPPPHTHRGAINNLINLLFMFLVCGSRPEYPGKTHAHTQHDGIKPACSPVRPIKANYMDQRVYMLERTCGWLCMQLLCASGYDWPVSNEICITGLVKRLVCHIFDFFPNFEPFLLNHLRDDKEGRKSFALHSASLGLWYRSTFQHRWNQCWSYMLLRMLSIRCSIISLFFFFFELYRSQVIR